jgi:hypothetical protein
MMYLAAQLKLKLHQMGVDQAFLAALLKDEVIYCHPPPGKGRAGMVWLLLRGLYGLKQPSHLFESHFADILVKFLGMTRLKADRSVYILRRNRGSGKEAFLIVCIFVDDLCIAYSDLAILDEFRTALQNQIKIKDVGSLRWCLGMLVEQTPETFTVNLSQGGFVRDLLSRTGFNTTSVKPRTTPAQPGQRLDASMSPQNPTEVAEMASHPYCMYRSLTGSLIYLAGATRPDISLAVNHLSRFVQNPGREHWNALEWLLRYLHGSPDLGVTYIGNSVQGVILEQEQRMGLRHTDDDLPNYRLLSESFGNNQVAYCDADWGSDVDGRRSTSGWLIFFNGGLIAWRVCRQHVCAGSSCEAELYSLADVIKEVRYLQQLLGELGYSQPRRLPGRGGATAGGSSRKNRGTIIFEDNAGTIAVSQNPCYHQRVKHVDLKYYFVLDYVEQGYVCVTFVPSPNNFADVMTKAVPNPIFQRTLPFLTGEWHRMFLVGTL